MITFHEIAGVPLAYDRDSHEAYGTRGRALGAAGPVTETFLAALELWMDELGELCPWGKPELLVTGGVRGNQPAPGEVSRHWEGRAIDIDSLWWSGRPPLVTREAWRDQAPLYLAVEATLRLRFGTVLDAHYNAAHVDHWHVDDGHAPGWHQSRSLIVFLQAALGACWGRPVEVDGAWGPRTAGAVREVLTSLLADDLRAAWPALLRATARRGFEATGSPAPR